MEFVAVALDLEYEPFVVYVVGLSVNADHKVYLLRKAQIAYLKADKTFTKIPSKYADFVDVFSPKSVVELPKYIRINDHAIKLVDNKQPVYGLIYGLGSIKLEILKVYIKNKLAKDFITPFKSFAIAFIFFDKKPDGSLRLCVDYQGLNNLTIKN